MQKKQNRKRYIGASDISYLYQSFDTKSFEDWWHYKLTGIKLTSFGNPSTDLGTIIEHQIARRLGIPKKYWDYKKVVKGKVYGCNTDAYDYEENILHEIKTMKAEKLFGIMNGAAIPIGYRRQMYHMMYVLGTREGYYHFYPVSDEDLENPFDVDVNGYVVTIQSEPDLEKSFKFDEHGIILEYFDGCMKDKRFPNKEELELELEIFKTQKIN